MELINLQVENLKTYKGFYAFQDCQVRIDFPNGEELPITVEGCIYPDFEKLDESVEGEDKVSYYVERATIEVSKIWEEDKQISLSPDLMRKVKYEIEESFMKKEVENN